MPLDNALAAACPLFERNWLSPVFVFFDYFPVFLDVAFYALSWYEMDFYMFFVSVALTLDIFWNTLWRVFIVADPNRFAGCGSLHQMPSLSSDQAVFVTTVYLTFSFLWRPTTSWIRVALANVAILVVLVSRVYIGINTLLELLFGAIDGVLLAMLFQLFVYFVLVPWMPRILDTPLCRWLGMKSVIALRLKVHHHTADKK